jgi:hypothetical protein
MTALLLILVTLAVLFVGLILNAVYLTDDPPRRRNSLGLN